MIRKGRKPKPRNEEEMLQQIEETAASKLRQAEHRNALKRAKRIAKLNISPLLGAANKPSEKKAKIQKKQLKPQDQKTSHLKHKSNVNSSILEVQEDLHEKFLEDIEQAPVEHSSASINIQQLREKLKEELIASELEAMADPSILLKKKEKKKRKSEEKDLDFLWTDKDGYMDSTSSKIYLDYNATTPLASEVVDCVTEALTDARTNPSSSTDIGRKAKELIDQSRKKIATMLNAEASEVIFLSGGTEANNMVLQTALKYFKSWAGKSMQMSSCKPHIVTTNVEHDAILLPLKHFEEEQQADVAYVPVSSTCGQVLAEEMEKQIRPHTCLVTVMLANNETGVIMPVAEISRKIRKLNEIRQMEGLCQILLHTDAAQAIGKITVDAKELGVDYLTVVGHKFYGPRIGALYVKNLGDSKTPLYPMFFGGGQEQRFRPGTENTPMIHGLGCAAELISRNLKIYQENMMKMRDLLEQSLAEEFGENVIVNCNSATRLPNTSSVSFRKTALTGGEFLSRCPELMASTGAACHGTGKPSEILMASGVTFEDACSAVRLSVGRDTTSKQIEQTVLMLKTAVNLLD